MTQLAPKPVASQDTVVSRLLANCAAAPDRLFCRLYANGQPVAISYRQLIDEAGRYGAAYRAAGVEPGDPVLVLFEHGPDLLYAFFGGLLAGAVPTFMAPLTPKQNPAHFWDGQRQVIGRIGATALATSPELKASFDANLPERGLTTVTPDSLPDDGIDPAVPSPADIAFLQHSSGTTSVKKGVALSHQAVLAQADAYANAIGLTQDDLIASWLPLYHDMGLIACCILPALKGIPVVALDPLEWVVRPSLLLEAIERHGATLAWLPNFAFHHILNGVPAGERYDLTSLRALIDCSEPCRPESLAAFAERFGAMGAGPDKLQACYALAENTFAVTQTRLDRPPRTERIKDTPFQTALLAVHAADGAAALAFLSCGTPVNGVSIRIVDEDRQPLCERAIGEIAVAGPSLATGYSGLPDETAARFDDGWYYTGDLGFLDRGELFVCGRLDDLLILNGRNYYAHDLEFLLNDIDGVLPGRSIALGVFDQAVGSQTLVILAETAEQEADERSALKKRIRQCLAAETGLTPAEVRLLPKQWLIKSTSGKISRRATLERYLKEQKGRGPS